MCHYNANSRAHFIIYNIRCFQCQVYDGYATTECGPITTGGYLISDVGTHLQPKLL